MGMHMVWKNRFKVRGRVVRTVDKSTPRVDVNEGGVEARVAAGMASR